MRLGKHLGYRTPLIAFITFILSCGKFQPEKENENSSDINNYQIGLNLDGCWFARKNPNDCAIGNNCPNKFFSFSEGRGVSFPSGDVISDKTYYYIADRTIKIDTSENNFIEISIDTERESIEVIFSWSNPQLGLKYDLSMEKSSHCSF